MADSSNRSASVQGAGAVIAATKLHVPVRTSRTVPRERLLSAVLARSDARLTLVDAPAGSGKTTLLSEWNAHPAEQRPFAWLSLDRTDNDPVRFFDCVIAALRTVAPGIAEGVRRELGSASLIDAVLPALINEIDGSGRALVLVLDDYHVIGDATVHEAVAFLLDHPPRGLHVAISTRSDPPLPLGRLRVLGQLTEVREADLRFTDAETAMLLNEVLGLHIPDDDVTRLRSRTEGWAAGLQLAALSLRGRADRHDFISTFAGDDRHLVDYLGFEVLAGQPPEVRDFLLETSILERMSGPVCDAVTERPGGAAMLELLDRENLFMVPLDSRREWYRYHHLFRELLQHQLRSERPAAVGDLHRRASLWHRERGLITEAVQHAIAGADNALASNLITEHWYAFLQRGRLRTVIAWLDALGEDVVRGDPDLCLVRAWVGVNTGRLEDVERWAAAAERAVDARDAEPGTQVVRSGVASLRAIDRYMSGDVGAAVEAGRRSLAMAPGHTPWRPVGCPVLGISLFWSGHSREAADVLERAVSQADSDGNHLAKVHALGGLAAISARGGDYDAAVALAGRSGRVAEAHGLSEHWATTLGRVAGGEALGRKGRVAEAAERIDLGLELSRLGLASLEQAYALICEAELCAGQGDHASAARHLSEAHAALERCRDPGLLAELLAGARRRLGLANGNGHRANGAAELSERELAVLRLLPSALSQREIGAALYVSLNTVKTHVKSIYRKLEADSRADAVARARGMGLI